DDLLAGDLDDPALLVGDVQGVRVGEARGAREDGHVVAGELAADHVHLPADHVLRPDGQVGDGDLVLDAIALPVHLPLVETGQVEHGLTQGLGRDRAGVDAHTADHVAPFDDGDPLLQLRGRDGRLLPSGPGTYDNHIEVGHTASVRAAGHPVKPSGRGARRGAVDDAARALLAGAVGAAVPVVAGLNAVADHLRTAVLADGR